MFAVRDAGKHHPMAVGDVMRFDQPDNVCFGCSPHNPSGLGLDFTVAGPGKVERRYTAPPHVCGAPGVVHGGIQAVLLDEAVGFAIHAHHDEGDDRDGELLDVVTVEFDLRYRRPVHAGVEVLIRGEVVRAEGRDYVVLADILDADGAVLTTATARWRRLR